MTLREYYGFPKGINVQMRYANFYTQQDDDYPCPANMKYAFAYQAMAFIKPLNTSNVTNMSYMFYECSSLKTAPVMDTTNVTNMDYMFYYCKALTTIPPLNTSKVTTMRQMFYYCDALTTIPPLDCSSISTKNYYPIYGYSNMPNIKNVGGFTNMKMSWDETYGLAKCPNLTYESCINILNGLYDFTGNGQTPSSTQGTLKVHANFLTLVGDEIAIGTNKGWKITT